MTNLVDGYKSTTKIMASTDLCLQSLNFHCMKLSLLNLRKDNCLTLNSCVKIFDPNPLLPPPQNICIRRFNLKCYFKDVRYKLQKFWFLLHSYYHHRLLPANSLIWVIWIELVQSVTKLLTKYTSKLFGLVDFQTSQHKNNAVTQQIHWIYISVTNQFSP